MRRWAAAVVAGLSAAWSGTDQLLGPSDPLVALVVTAALAALLVPLAGVVARRLLVPRPRGWRVLWPGLALAAGAYLVVAIPVDLRPFVPHRLEIRATGERSPRAGGTAVTIEGVYPDDRGRLPWRDFTRVGRWETGQHVAHSAHDQPATLRWQGRVRGPMWVRFVAQPGSGVVELDWDGHRKRLDLWARARRARLVRLPSLDGGQPGPPASFRPVLLGVASAIAMASLLLVVGVWLATRPSAAVVPAPGRASWLGYAAPCVAVWTAYLLALWPGLLSTDSLEQWAQVTSGRFNNFHPAGHTLAMWLVTRAWASPAAVVAAQLLAMALVFGLVVRELGAWGVPAWARAAVVVAFAASPVNGFMLATLWKDVGYTVACLLVTYVLLQLVRTRGEAARAAASMGLFALGLAVVALFRHNGALVAVGLALGLPLAWRGVARRRLALAGLAGLAAYAVVVWPVFAALGVTPSRPALVLARQIQQLAAIVQDGAPLGAAEAALVARIDPRDSWRRRYSCYSLNPIFTNVDMDLAAVDGRPEDVVRAWWTLAPRHVGLLVAHQVGCAASLLWRVRQASDAWLYTTALPPPEDGRGSRWPWLLRALTALGRWTDEPSRVWWTWRPALYLYVLVAGLVIAAARLRDWRVLLVAAPALLNSLVWVALVSSQDARYQYPVYVAALVVPALIVAARRR